jgi:hypothetical protein
MQYSFGNSTKETNKNGSDLTLPLACCILRDKLSPCLLLSPTKMIRHPFESGSSAGKFERAGFDDHDPAETSGSTTRFDITTYIPIMIR